MRTDEIHEGHWYLGQFNSIIKVMIILNDHVEYRPYSRAWKGWEHIHSFRQWVKEDLGPEPTETFPLPPEGLKESLGVFE